MTLKEEVEDPKIINQICAILIPREFTRVDGIIDIVFSAAEDVRKEEEVFEDEEEDQSPGEAKKPKFTPVSFHDACISRIQIYLGQPLIKHTRASFSSSDGSVALICAVSREHTKRGQPSYWFAFHPHQKSHVEVAERGLIALGCSSAGTVLVIPYNEFSAWLEGMNMTHKEDRYYWHISIFREGEKLVLHRRKGQKRIDLSKYLLTSA